MLSAFVSVAVMCAGCAIDEVSAVGARPWDVQAPLIDQQVQDGCARFALKVVNGVATVEALYNTNGCQTDALKLEADSSPVFDSTTGVLRVPVVMRNLGTSPVVAPARIRFNADSSQFINAQGQVIAGTPNIVATNYDTANVSGRSGQWRYDTLLASPGQAQLLMPNAVSRRRWLEFSGSDWSQRIRIKLPTAAGVSPAVPALAPDSIPAFLQDPANIQSVSNGGLPYFRHHIILLFQQNASQSDRSAAVNAVSGTVVGGLRFGNGDGYYIVRLPVDSTSATIENALTLLKSLATVRYSDYYYANPAGPTHRRPSDGAAFTSQDWNVTPYAGWAQAASSDRWALEAVSAPLAWGCAVGDSATYVAILDQGFAVTGAPDVAPNVLLSPISDRSGDPVDHGTAVASVLAARGNNAIGITGMAWRSSLELQDVLLRDSLLAPIRDSVGRLQTMPLTPFLVKHLQPAIRNGARIVNLSIGADSFPILARTSAGYAKAASINSQVVTALQTAFPYGVASPNPLFVISAGNVPQGDGFESMFPTLKDSLGSTVLVVAAARSDSSLWRSSSGSSYIDVAAPGAGVSVLRRGSNTPIRADGASFATPIVSGIAALLMSFDPSLTSQEVRQLIIDGAIQSGKTAGGYPFVDAYKSIILAARRTAAPLCGNRVWASNRAIHVERGSTVETLPVTLPTDSVWNLEVAHGGKQINYEFPGPYGLPTVGTVLWTAGGWVSGSSTEIPEADRSGASRSVYMRSHDADSLLSVQVSQTTASVDVEIALFNDAGLTQLRSTTISLPGLAPAPAANTEPTEWVFVAGAYPQNGGDAVVAVNRVVAANSTGVTQCPNGASVTCQPGAIYYRYYWRPKQTDLYRVNISSAPMTATHIATIPDSLVYDIAFSEDGKEKLLRMGRDSIYNSGDGVWELHSLVCKQSWSKPTFGTTSTTIPFDSTQARRIVDVFGCASDGPMLYRNGAGTSAPRVGPQRRVTANSR